LLLATHDSYGKGKEEEPDEKVVPCGERTTKKGRSRNGEMPKRPNGTLWGEGKGRSRLVEGRNAGEETRL